MDNCEGNGSGRGAALARVGFGPRTWLLAAALLGLVLTVGWWGNSPIVAAQGNSDPVISVGDASLMEGNAGTSTLTFTVALSASPNADVTVKASAVSPRGANRAAPGVDFRGFRGQQLTWKSGATGAALNQTVDVTIYNDRAVESDETFVLRVNHLSSADSRVHFLGKGKKIDAVGKILNDDPRAGAITISVNDVSQSEGDGKGWMTFTVSLSGSPGAEVMVKASAVPGRRGSADRQDFGGFRGRTLTWAAGASGDALSQQVRVRIKGDTTAEPDETFVLRVNHLQTTDANVGFPSHPRKVEGTGTIQNDD